MNYIQLPFNFLLKNSFKINRINFMISLYDYFTIDNDFTEFPYPKPEYSENNYHIITEEWKTECIKNFDFRNQLKDKLFEKIGYRYKYLLETRDEPTKTNFCLQFLDDYKFYHKELVDIWIDLWENVNYELETLETLIIFNSFLHEHCLNSKAIEIDNEERNLLWKEASKEMKEENEYWSRNIYEEGGGGDEWSDPSNFF